MNPKELLEIEMLGLVGGCEVKRSVVEYVPAYNYPPNFIGPPVLKKIHTTVFVSCVNNKVESYTYEVEE